MTLQEARNKLDKQVFILKDEGSKVKILDGILLNIDRHQVYTAISTEDTSIGQLNVDAGNGGFSQYDVDISMIYANRNDAKTVRNAIYQQRVTDMHVDSTT